jgi:glycine dehydrogenase subunit 1
MPGRLCGQTLDKDGKRGFVLTISTREQHIRREKATSNICSNQGLCALTSAVFMSCLGKTGLKQIAEINFNNASWLKKKLVELGFEDRFKSSSIFNEFVLKAPKGFEKVWKKLSEKKIVCGLPLDKFYEGFENNYLFCVTEAFSKENMENLLENIKKEVSND